MPSGRITRGTTGTNRLRRMDRWIAQLPAAAPRGAAARGRPRVRGIRDDGARAAPAARAHARRRRGARTRDRAGAGRDREAVRAAGVRFALGGFEVPGEPATVIRAANVLRQYDESEVLAAWHQMVSRLQPGGALVEGTCNEVGRVASWVEVTADGPQSLTISLRLGVDRWRELRSDRRLWRSGCPRCSSIAMSRASASMTFSSNSTGSGRCTPALGVYSPSQRWVAVVESPEDQWMARARHPRPLAPRRTHAVLGRGRAARFRWS